MSDATDAQYMRRCFDLARRGEGWVSPNPMVGAVLVHAGRIIGEGWHQRWGGPHAEVHCIRSVAPENQRFIQKSTLYCSLEPCFHHGKTPPCVELVLAQKIPHVVIANTDPNPKVAGQSVAALRAAGVRVDEGLLAEEGQWLNRSFFHWIISKRPYVVLKWAQSADGFLGRQGERTAISSPEALRLVHRWRSGCDAILVGTNTALTDNPALDTRFFPGKNPLRIVLDRHSKMPASHRLLDDKQETWVLGPAREGHFERTVFLPNLLINKMLEAENAKVPGMMSIPDLLQKLHEAQRATLLVEGGALLLQQFLDTGCWDEIRVLQSERCLGGGIKAPQLPAGLRLRAQGQVGGNDEWRMMSQE
jgi:diaminohydroxyphosphoribosylaminopyrimidine deaminase/5-amino-6-(5-phosphoribosylamino)uracil reductase